MFTKNSLETDEYLKSKVSASGAVPIEAVAQAPNVLDICSNPEIVKKALFECRSVYIAEDGVRSFIKPEQNTLILRDIPSSTSPEEIAGLFSSTPDCPPAEVVKPDMNDTWFVSFASEGDARAALLAIRNARFLDKPVRARLKTESLIKSFYSGNAYGFAGQVGMPNFNFSSPAGSPQIPGMQGMFFPSGYPMHGPPSNYPIPPMVAMPPMMGYPMMMPRPMQWAPGAMQYQQQQPFTGNGMQGRQGRGGVQRQHRNGRGTPNGRGGFTQGDITQGGRGQYGQNQYPRGYNQGHQYRQGTGGAYRGQGERRYPSYDEMSGMSPDGFKSGDDLDGESGHFLNDDNMIHDDHDGDKLDIDNGEKSDYNQGDGDYGGFSNDGKGIKNRKNRKNEDGTQITEPRKKDDIDVGDVEGDKGAKNRNNRTAGAKKDNKKGDKVGGRRDVRPAADFNFESDFPTLGNNSPGSEGNPAAHLSVAAGSKVFMSGYAAVAAAAGKSPITVPTLGVSSSVNEKSSKDVKSKDSAAKAGAKSDKTSSVLSSVAASSSSPVTSLSATEAPQSEIPITFGAFDAPLNSNSSSADKTDVKSLLGSNSKVQRPNQQQQQQQQQQPDDSKVDSKSESVWGSKRSFVEVVRTAK